MSETDPEGNTTTYTYNSFNEPLTVTNVLQNAHGTTTNQIYSYTYNAKGQVTSSDTPVDNNSSSTAEQTTYDYYTADNDSSDPSGLGQLKSVTAPGNDRF